MFQNLAKYYKIKLQTSKTNYNLDKKNISINTCVFVHITIQD